MSGKLIQSHQNLTAEQNFIINGGFIVDQRYASGVLGHPAAAFTAGYNNYIMDRWLFISNEVNTTGTTIGRVPFSLGQTDVPGNPKFFARLSHVSVSGGASQLDITQKMEFVNILSDQKVGVSFYAKSNTGAIPLTVKLKQHFGTGGSPSPSHVTVAQAGSVGNVWTRFTFTFDLLSIAGKTLGTGTSGDHIALIISGPLNTTFSLDLANISLTAHQPRDWHEIRRSFERELKLCQRFYWTTYDQLAIVGSATFTGAINQFIVNAAGIRDYIQFPQTLRSNPIITVYSPNDGASNFIYNRSVPANFSVSALEVGENGFHLSSGAGTAGHQWAGHFVAKAELP